MPEIHHAPAPACAPRPTPAGRVRELLRRRVELPLLALLDRGVSPQRLAWSLAVGLAVGINPLLGSTTVLGLLVAVTLRLNLVASQIANHIVYPLQLALFFVFIRMGDACFHTGGLPLGRGALLEAVRLHPWDTTRLLWRWEWHALVVWAAACAVLVPLGVAVLEAVLGRALARLRARHAT